MNDMNDQKINGMKCGLGSGGRLKSMFERREKLASPREVWGWG